jgi:hypothetical protein
MGARSFWGGPSPAVTTQNDCFRRRLRWRPQKLFKLYAKLLRREISLDYNWLLAARIDLTDRKPHSKFAIRSNVVRRTIVEHGCPENNR